MLVERIKDRIAEQMADCAPHEMATGETDLMGQSSEIVAAGETDLEAREDPRKWKRSLWWREQSGAPAIVLREIRGLTAESNVKYSLLCEVFF